MKSFKKLLLPLAILVVLIVAVVIVFVVKNKNTDTPEEKSSYQLLDIDLNEVKSFKVDRKDKESLTILSATNSEGSTYFTIEGESPNEEDYSQDFFTSYMLVMLNFSSDSKMDAAGLNLADYGLADPECKITITKKDSSTTVINLGNDTVSGGKCYVSLDGDNSIYTIPTIKKTYAENDVIQFYKTVNMDVDFGSITNIVFERYTDNVKLQCTSSIYETGDAVFKVYDPVEKDAGAYLSTLLKAIGTLEISSFTNLTEEEKETVGLNDPDYYFSFEDVNGQVKDIYLSRLNNGIYYGYGSICDQYFMISSEQIKYIDSPLMDLINPYINYFTVLDVKQIDCEMDDGSKFTFSFQTSKSISSEDAEVYLNGRDCKIFSSSGRCYAAILFEALACVDIGGVELDANPTYSNPVLKYKIFYNDYRTSVVEFVVRDTSSYYCFVDGEYSGFYVYAKELYNNGGEDTYSYGIVPAYELLDTAIDNNLNGIYDIKIEE